MATVEFKSREDVRDAINKYDRYEYRGREIFVRQDYPPPDKRTIMVHHEVEAELMIVEHLVVDMEVTDMVIETDTVEVIDMVVVTDMVEVEEVKTMHHLHHHLNQVLKSLLVICHFLLIGKL